MDPEFIQTMLQQDMEEAQSGNYGPIATEMHRAAMELNFVPRGTTTGRIPANKPNKANTPKSMPFSRAQLVAHHTSLDLVAYDGGQETICTVNMCKTRFDLEGAPMKFINRFIDKLQANKKVVPYPAMTEILPAIIQLRSSSSEGPARYANRLADVAEIMLNRLNRDSSMTEAYRRNYNAPPPQTCASDAAVMAGTAFVKDIAEGYGAEFGAPHREKGYSQGTQRFLDAQRKAKPKRLVDKEILRHKREKKAKELERKSGLWQEGLPPHQPHHHQAGHRPGTGSVLHLHGQGQDQGVQRLPQDHLRQRDEVRRVDAQGKPQGCPGGSPRGHPPAAQHLRPQQDAGLP
jgi:hypothetical protein